MMRLSDGESAREGFVCDVAAAGSAKTNIAADNGGIALAASNQGIFPTVASFWGSTWDQLKPWFDIWFGNSNWSTQVTHAERMQMTATGSVYRILQQQWGYNYGTGNTVLWATNSPAGWLNQTATNTYNAAGRISGLLDRGNVTNEHLAAIELHTSDTKGRISGLLDRGNVTNDHLSDISTNTYNIAGRSQDLCLMEWAKRWDAL